MKCLRIAHYELLKGYSDAQIAKLLHMSEGQLAVFRYKNAGMLTQCLERISRYAAEKTQSSRQALRVGAAKRVPEVLQAWDDVLASDNLAVKARVAETIANRVDPIKHQVQHEVMQLSQKSIAILHRYGQDPEEIGELVMDAEVKEIEDADADSA